MVLLLLLLLNVVWAGGMFGRAYMYLFSCVNVWKEAKRLKTDDPKAAIDKMRDYKKYQQEVKSTNKQTIFVVSALIRWLLLLLLLLWWWWFVVVALVGCVVVAKGRAWRISSDVSMANQQKRNEN